MAFATLLFQAPRNQGTLGLRNEELICCRHQKTHHDHHRGDPVEEWVRTAMNQGKWDKWLGGIEAKSSSCWTSEVDRESRRLPGARSQHPMLRRHRFCCHRFETWSCRRLYRHYSLDSLLSLDAISPASFCSCFPSVSQSVLRGCSDSVESFRRTAYTEGLRQDTSLCWHCTDRRQLYA